MKKTQESYRPVVIGVGHKPENLPQLLKLIDEHAKDKRRIGLELPPSSLAAIKKGLQFPGFFYLAGRHALERGLTIHCLIDDRFHRALAKIITDPEKRALAAHYRAAMAPAMTSMMLKKARESKPEIIVIGGNHAQIIARELGVEPVMVGNPPSEQFVKDQRRRAIEEIARDRAQRRRK